ncbi:MAG: biosynthetic arginine decarboxylase [Deltaproteobacteria bacterium]|nr:MAG: biosynthetic arginine decarboxylase [Deltaproteobacteria bacterium]
MAWTIADSEELYGVPYWGKNLFHINAEGHLVCTPAGTKKGDIDLHELTEELVERGIDLPVLLRMPQVAERRIDLMNHVFADAIVEYAYEGRYRGVYPIKVNQQRQLVEEILRAGRRHHVGLEAGSKPELLVAMALVDDPEALIICNGYKDRRYVETALTSEKLGRETIMVVEKLSELDTILEAAERLGVEPRLGVRAKLSAPGKGRWQSSAGDRAKFGLSALAIVEMVEKLREAGKLHCLKLLHFHIGSQVTSIQTFKRALREATRLYTELVRMGAPMGLIDCGGGLGVDYDGSRTTFESSKNYTDAEYAADVVAHIGSACSDAGIPHPDIVTESGRATVAHCSVLLFDILGVESMPVEGPPEPREEGDHDLLDEMRDVFDRITMRSYQEAWHDAMDIRMRSRSAFELGVIGLEQLAKLDRLFWKVCGRIRRIVQDLAYVPDELDSLEPGLSDTYYGNFSVFQSAPDAWAIDQLFPCVPVHRHTEEPVRRAVIADMTCDSDGKISRFVDRRDVKKVLELHTYTPGEPYVLALCLVGAYQEILGDMHNLFGDTHAVHLRVDDDGEWHIDQVIEGDTVESVTGYVQYERKDLIHRIRTLTEARIKAKQLNRKDAAQILSFYREGLDGYTYLGH